MAFSVFISYTHKDKLITSRVEQDLKKKGYTVWKDVTDIRPGTRNWDIAVREAIRSVDAVILIATPNTPKSSVVNGELDIAEVENIVVIPIWAAGRNWIGSIPLSRSMMQHSDIRGFNYSKGMKQVTDNLKLMESKKSISTPVIPNDTDVPQSSNSSLIEMTSTIIGRGKALADLDTLIKQGHHVILIRGVGGVGKTLLALTYLHNQQFDIILELYMAKETQEIGDVESRVEEWLVSSLNDEPGRDYAITLDRFRRKLRDRNLHIGVLIDNLEPALGPNGEFIPSLHRYIDLFRVLCDPTIQAVTIITSRESLNQSSLTIQDYYLRGLEIEAWKKYFEDLSIQIDIKLLTTIHQAYGGNPKAMQIIAGTITNDYLGDATTYWRLNGTDLLVEQELENLVVEQFNRLSESNLSAYNLLCRMGCYRYQDIPRIPVDGALSLLWDVAEDKRLRVFHSLRDRSLIEFSEGKCWLHPSTRAEAVARLRESGDWEKTNRSAADFWTNSVKSVINTNDAIQAFEAYHHFVAIDEYESAGQVILNRRTSPDRSLSYGGEPLDAAFYRLGLLQLQTAAILGIVDKIGTSYTLGRLFDALGLTFRLQGRISDALACGDKVKDIADALSSKELTITYLTLSGYCYTDLWEIENAIDVFLSLVNVSDNTDFQRYTVMGWSYLAYLYSYLQPISKDTSMQYIQKVSGSLDRDDLNSWRKAYGMLLIGIANFNLGNYDEAFDLCNKVITIATQSNHTQVWARALSCEARIYAIRSDFDKALRRHEKALELLQGIAAQADLAEAYYQTGITLNEAGDNAMGLLNFQQAVAIFQQIGAKKQIEKVREIMVL